MEPMGVIGHMPYCTDIRCSPLTCIVHKQTGFFTNSGKFVFFNPKFL